MNSKDPYADHRDSKGRFTKGNPGPQTGKPWSSEAEVIKKWNFLIQLPPRCICKNRKYKYRIKDSVIYCKCNVCSEEYVFDAYQNSWAQSKFALINR